MARNTASSKRSTGSKGTPKNKAEVVVNVKAEPKDGVIPAASSTKLTIIPRARPVIPPPRPEKPWQHPDELTYIQPENWSQATLVADLCDHGFSVPARPPPSAAATSPFTTITKVNGTTTVVPKGYRLPLMFAMKFQWESLRLVLTSPLRDAEWDDYKFDILHVSRLCRRFLEEAEAAMAEQGMDRLWRSPMFDRALTRYYRRWLVSREEFLRDFWKEFGEEEYQRDAVKNDWNRFVLKGHKGFRLTPEECAGGLSYEKVTQGLALRLEEEIVEWDAPSREEDVGVGSGEGAGETKRRGAGTRKRRRKRKREEVSDSETDEEEEEDGAREEDKGTEPVDAEYDAVQKKRVKEAEKMELPHPYPRKRPANVATMELLGRRKRPGGLDSPMCKKAEPAVAVSSSKSSSGGDGVGPSATAVAYTKATSKEDEEAERRREMRNRLQREWRTQRKAERERAEKEATEAEKQEKEKETQETREREKEAEEATSRQRGKEKEREKEREKEKEKEKKQMDRERERDEAEKDKERRLESAVARAFEEAQRAKQKAAERAKRTNRRTTASKDMRRRVSAIAVVAAAASVIALVEAEPEPPSSPLSNASVSLHSPMPSLSLTPAGVTTTAADSAPSVTGTSSGENAASASPNIGAFSSSLSLISTSALSNSTPAQNATTSTLPTSTIAVNSTSTPPTLPNSEAEAALASFVEAWGASPTGSGPMELDSDDDRNCNVTGENDASEPLPSLEYASGADEGANEEGMGKDAKREQMEQLEVGSEDDVEMAPDDAPQTSLSSEEPNPTGNNTTEVNGDGEGVGASSPAAKDKPRDKLSASASASWSARVNKALERARMSISQGGTAAPAPASAPTPTSTLSQGASGSAPSAVSAPSNASPGAVLDPSSASTPIGNGGVAGTSPSPSPSVAASNKGPIKPTPKAKAQRTQKSIRPAAYYVPQSIYVPGPPPWQQPAGVTAGPLLDPLSQKLERERALKVITSPRVATKVNTSPPITAKVVSPHPPTDSPPTPGMTEPELSQASGATTAASAPSSVFITAGATPSTAITPEIETRGPPAAPVLPFQQISVLTVAEPEGVPQSTEQEPTYTETEPSPSSPPNSHPLDPSQPDPQSLLNTHSPLARSESLPFQENLQDQEVATSSTRAITRLPTPPQVLPDPPSSMQATEPTRQLSQIQSPPPESRILPPLPGPPLEGSTLENYNLMSAAWALRSTSFPSVDNDNDHEMGESSRGSQLDYNDLDSESHSFQHNHPLERPHEHRMYMSTPPYRRHHPYPPHVRARYHSSMSASAAGPSRYYPHYPPYYPSASAPRGMHPSMDADVSMDVDHDDVEMESSNPVVKKVVAMFQNTLMGLTEILEASGHHASALEQARGRYMGSLTAPLASGSASRRSSAAPSVSTTILPEENEQDDGARRASVSGQGEFREILDEIRTLMRESKAEKSEREQEAIRMRQEMDDLRRQLLELRSQRHSPEPQRIPSSSETAVEKSPSFQLSHESPSFDSSDIRSSPEIKWDSLPHHSSVASAMSSHPLAHLLALEPDPAVAQSPPTSSWTHPPTNYQEDFSKVHADFSLSENHGEDEEDENKDAEVGQRGGKGKQNEESPTHPSSLSSGSVTHSHEQDHDGLPLPIKSQRKHRMFAPTAGAEEHS
ncbi:hypothetical protein H0H81_012684 [Sphagnurus paluster]|uniref:Uncharacterized protein n=1 Tax=Sphagnurus paluster TaxID=117069 RepID=A0A9P7GNP0_9AGAR|nr:hypothetical protein H0H81_012684 [Sphagnurus paluster]